MNVSTTDCGFIERSCNAKNDIFAGHEIILALVVSLVILLFSSRRAH
jgi:hypothetical protein